MNEMDPRERPQSMADPLLPTDVDRERQERIDRGYQHLVRDLFGDPEMTLTPEQLPGAIEILNRGMERHFNPKDRRVITLNYGLEGDTPLSLGKIAARDEFSVTHQRVSYRKHKGLSRLRHPGRGFRELRKVVGRPELE